jgi:hypothetical protein
MSAVGTAILIGAGVSALIGGAGAASSGAQKRKAERQERAARARRQVLEANRQDPIDPYADLANPYANLQVATQANIMQAEQADISLASSLDTLRATGASAGGATALARAAMQSKRGVSASIEQQEAKNAQLRARGEIQTAQMRGQGEMFKYQATEAREMQELDRAASLESSYNQQAAAYGAQSSAMAGQAVGAVATGIVGAAQAGVFKGTTPPPNKLLETFGTQGIKQMQANPWLNPTGWKDSAAGSAAMLQQNQFDAMNLRLNPKEDIGYDPNSRFGGVLNTTRAMTALTPGNPYSLANRMW